MRTTVTLQGTITGNLWMGGRGWTDIHWILSDRKRLKEPAMRTLVGHVAAKLQCGDFDGPCKLRDAYITITRSKTSNERTRTYSREFPCEYFPSLQPHIET